MNILNYGWKMTDILILLAKVLLISYISGFIPMLMSFRDLTPTPLMGPPTPTPLKGPPHPNPSPKGEGLKRKQVKGER
jgi:hypothetical protein